LREKMLRLLRQLLAVLAALSALLWLYDIGKDSVRCAPAPPALSRYTCPMHGYGWQLPGTRLLLASVYSSETRWGNELSRYWQGRGMARLGGLSFLAVGDFSHAWLRFLPLYVPAREAPESCETFDAACAACDDWKYSHKCLGGWTSVRGEVVTDTRAALARYARRKRRALPNFGPADVVIHNRCSKDVWFWHGEYGPVAFSLYAGLGAERNGTIYVVGVASQERGPRAHAAYTGRGLFPPCAAKLRALSAQLSEWYPHARVVLGDGWDAFDDFSHMVWAPTLVKDASSFGLWAGMANSGRVISAHLPDSVATPTFAADGWEWNDAPVLYPAEAERLGLNTSDTDAIIRFLVEH